MHTEAVFDNIAEAIKKELKQAKNSIFIAVAWFTNRFLFDELVAKQNEGCSINLIVSNDQINTNSNIDFTQIESDTSSVYFAGDGDADLMHNKFCVIDHDVVITGSYNWSFKAENNNENIVITKGDVTLAEQFISEFNRIVVSYFPNEHINRDFPLDVITKRFEILINYIHLEDVNEIEKEVMKLLQYDFNSDVNRIVGCLRNKEYASGVTHIQEFIYKSNQLALWADPKIVGLKLEIKVLENKLNAYDNEKLEIEKMLFEFQLLHTKELGDIILEILRLRKIIYKKSKPLYEEASQDEKKYKEQFVEDSKKKVFDLTEDEKVELKKRFRKATTYCHPDKVSLEYEEAAREIFVELKEAYDSNDLSRVISIEKSLSQGNFKPKSETVDEKELLKANINAYKIKIEKIRNEIQRIKEDDSYKTISSISDWGEYFESTRKKLNMELNYLNKEVKES